MSWFNGVETPADPRKKKRLRPAKLFRAPPPKGRRGWSLGAEESLQICIVEWIVTVAPHCVVFSIPNERKATITEVQILKSMGLLPGITDLCVLAPVKGNPVFDKATGWAAAPEHWEPHMIEVKTEEGRLGDNQEEFKMLCAKRGIHHAVVRSIEDAREAFRFWNIKTRESAMI